MNSDNPPENLTVFRQRLFYLTVLITIFKFLLKFSLVSKKFSLHVCRLSWLSSDISNLKPAYGLSNSASSLTMARVRDCKRHTLNSACQGYYAEGITCQYILTWSSDTSIFYFRNTPHISSAVLGDDWKSGPILIHSCGAQIPDRI